MKTKICRICKKLKTLSEFYKRNNYQGTSKIYLKSQCKDCDKTLARNWVVKNRKRFNAYHTEYYHKHKND